VAGCESYLNIHGWSLTTADWGTGATTAYDELHLVAQSILDLKTAAGWSITDYADTMTGNGKYSLRLNRASGYFWDGNRPADVQTPGWGSTTITMNVYNALFDHENLASFNLMHEQAHVWDAATGGAMSNNLATTTGSYSKFIPHALPKYISSGTAASEYHPDRKEDWAETVAAAVYPDGARSVKSGTSDPQMGTMRQNYIQPFLPKSALFSGKYTLHTDP
jgi:hypothetical protein